MTMPPLAEEVREQVPLAPLTTLGVGGPARFLCRVTTPDELRRAIAWASERDLPWLVLGGGSNVVVSDDGFPGLVACLELEGLRVEEGRNDVVVRAAAGEDWDGFVSTCVTRGWAGIECLSGIPGRVGATPIQNVGAYGQEVGETIVGVRAYDALADEWIDFGADACLFGYRHSRFKTESPRRHVVVEVSFRLRPGGAPGVRYAELARVLAERCAQGAAAPGLGQVREAVLAVRRSKSMVFDVADPDSHSVGSFFVNPVVDEAGLEAVTEAGRRRGVLGTDERPPHHAAGEGRSKLPAAWLIEKAGFPRGFEHGRVALSRSHALAIVNRGEGTARDVVALAMRIREGVQQHFGVLLVPEPVLVGLTIPVA